MCSIFKFDNYIGRNFDYEVNYDEEVRVVHREEFDNKYGIIGVVTGIVRDFPLFYDAMNEYGLCMGGLAFRGNAVYNPIREDSYNIPSYNFILEILGNYKSVEEVKSILDTVNITNEAYSPEMPPSDLHWFIADSNDSIIVEQTDKGLNWYSGDVMTNNPPYNQQSRIGEFYISLVGSGDFNPNDYPNYETRGNETVRLQGDYTSEGRFARLSYLKKCLSESDVPFDKISQVFHLCSSVEQIFGVTHVSDSFEYTIYSVVYDLSERRLYLKFYDDLDVECYDNVMF